MVAALMPDRIADNVIENSGQLDPVVMFTVIIILFIIAAIIGAGYAVYQWFNN